MSRYDALSAPGYWQYVTNADSFLPLLDVAPFPISSSVRYCWQLWPWEMKNDTGGTRSVLSVACVWRGRARGDGDILMEQDGLNWQLRWELKVLFLNALGWLLGWSMAWCDIGRKGGAAGWTVYSRVGGTTVFTQHPTSQHVKICKYTHTNLH